MALPGFEEVEKFVASSTPSRFYLPLEDQDFAEAADLLLVVQGAPLPAHGAILAARAPAFSPLLAMRRAGQQPQQQLERPFGIDSLPHALLFLRLCYRPEQAAQLMTVVDWLPGLLHVLHKVGATSLLGQNPHKLCSAASGRQIVALLDAAAQLPGLEGVAGECAARLINELRDSHPPGRSQADAPGGQLGFSSLALLPGWPLEQLGPAAMQLLLRAALTVIADARGRSRLRFYQSRAAAGVEVSQCGLLFRDDLQPMALTAGRTGSFVWDLGNVPEDQLDDTPISSRLFRIGGYAWRLRLVGLQNLPEHEFDAEQQGAGGEGGAAAGGITECMCLWLEAAEPEALPPAGLEVFMRVCLADRRGPTYVSIRKDVVRAVTRTQPAAAVRPLATLPMLELACFDQHQLAYRLKVEVALGVSDRAPNGTE